MDMDLPLVVITRMYRNYIKKQTLLHERFNLTEQQAVFLIVISKSADGVKMTELTEQLGVDKSNTTRIIQQLEDKGFVVKDMANGRRKYRIFLSPKGKETVAEVEKLQRNDVKNFLIDFTEEEKLAIEKFIDKIVSYEQD